jgi:hypothetical protein
MVACLENGELVDDRKQQFETQLRPLLLPYLRESLDQIIAASSNKKSKMHPIDEEEDDDDESDVTFVPEETPVTNKHLISASTVYVYVRVIVWVCVGMCACVCISMFINDFVWI